MSKQENSLGLHKDMDPEVFTKLVVDECRRLRAEVKEKDLLIQELRADIEERDRKIVVLENNLKASNDKVKNNPLVLQQKELNATLKQENRKLRKKNDELRREIFNSIK